jgi:hypothetical protein
MAKKNVWLGRVTLIGSIIRFWVSTFIFLVIVCAVIGIAFVLTISLEVSAVWHKLKQLLNRKNKNG